MSVTVPDSIAFDLDDFTGSGALPAGEEVLPPSPAPTGDPSDRVRAPFRPRRDTYERAKYWASKAGISVNEYVAEGLEEKIARENGDYDLPTLEQARLNQLVDQVSSLSTNLANLQSVVTDGFGSLLGLTRGDNYLLDDEDGELGGA